ncbi:DMT family transporter [Sunxiuqinia indica]|uniref:DMT family transporter n=1 Tax=Sunxiuqinia indica TaxID=2692584 RepID=UPI0013567B23|nr:DMT family transporter [Sunxiuqinia indica]
MKSDRFKGYFFAAIATVTFSSIYIFSKAALNEVHLAQFGVYWFFVAFVLSATWLLKTGGHRAIPKLAKRQWRILALLGVLEILTTASFFLSIQIIPDPAVTSFIGNLFPVILTVMGIVFLHERFTWVESFGAILALIGAFIISYQGGTTLSDLFIPGAGIVLINSFFAATASMVVKVNVKKMSPELLITNRALWLFIFSVVMLLVYKQSLVIPVKALINIAIGATLGPFFAVMFIYYSFRYIEVSKSSVVQSLKGVCVLIASFLYFHTLPLPHQLAGGILSVVGVFIISVSKARLSKRGRIKN